jgi:hypothetical protein
MSEFDVDAMIEALRGQLEAEGAEMEGLSLDDLRDAISHPKAAAHVAEAMALDAQSVKAGDPAPDFALPRLGGSKAGEVVTLSSHFGTRPVALIFGSYT